MIKPSIIAAVSVFAATTAVFAAKVSWLGMEEQNGTRVSIIRIEGPVEDGDTESFLQVLAPASQGVGRWDRLVVQLNSPGGSYPEGLLLAETFRRNGVATEVVSGDYCYSACAIAFLGGSERYPDVEPVAEGALSNQPPDRSLAIGAELGFHAPYLDIPASDYSAENVQDAYRLAVDSISMLIALADHLYVEPAELPRLLAPGRDEAFMADDVDSVRSLWIKYTDYSLQPRHLRSITRSMVANACINRWYHTGRRSALAGYEIAQKVQSEFELGSRLLGNGEKAFGALKIGQGAVDTWIAYLPIAMTSDGRNFVWCVFDSGKGMPSVMYRAAGTVEELFAPYRDDWNVWALQARSDLLLRPREAQIDQSLRVLDMVPADTKLLEVLDVIDGLQRIEADLADLAE